MSLRFASAPYTPWIATSTGGRFDLLSPSAAQVDWRDIATHLANLCRWNGALAGDLFYSVAEHSSRVALLVQQTDPSNHRAVLYAALHDAHEAYLGDWTSPLKRAITHYAGQNILGSLANLIDSAIFEAFGLPPMSDDIEDMIRHADLTLLATEKRDLMTPHPAWQIALPAPLTGRIIPNSRLAARDNYARMLANAVRACGLDLPIRREMEVSHG
ncbi:hypothetical protein ACFPL7_22050 [Dongia soli]|uniref:Phosphohydrolase n=1 Tax=Dongia soli TaxID=600628 RepID=A0ABU5E9Q3_9PROT|nr:hypothetical protein [Dongia soli]MDY0882273.1 hypothetical protein [Dongia soli]